MRYSLIKHSLQVIIMLAFISKAFALGKAPEDFPLMLRQINLSGNIVHFAMPENFSRDMPAEDMLETVNLSDKTVYQDAQKFTLIRRWWDFKDSGFFGKEYGTLMMSLYIKDAADTLPITTLKPLDFIDIIIDDIEKNKSGEDGTLRVHSDHFPAYKEESFGEQRWLQYAQGPLDGSQYSLLYAIPITAKQYIVAEFVTAPNNNIGIRSFIENHTGPFLENIMKSFHIDYVTDNPVKQAVLKSSSKPLQELIDEKLERIEKAAGDQPPPPQFIPW